MACKNTCKLCKNLIISTDVVFNATLGNLYIQIPEGNYNECQKYCIVVAQTIPTDTTIGAPVYIQMGTGNAYPLQKRNCTQATACAIRSRTKYSTVVKTDSTGGVFRLCGDVACAPSNNLAAIS
jgi:hypothetical protein